MKADYPGRIKVEIGPSPRNNIWLKKNQWSEEEEVPFLKEMIKSVYI